LTDYIMQTSKTAAVREARRHVFIQGRGTSWQITSPFDAGNLRGPYTTTNASSYFEAQALARSIKARIALTLMGKMDEHAAYAIYNSAASNINDLVDAALVASGV
jgi:hypothetical protein